MSIVAWKSKSMFWNHVNQKSDGIYGSKAPAGAGPGKTNETEASHYLIIFDVSINKKPYSQFVRSNTSRQPLYRLALLW